MGACARTHAVAEFRQAAFVEKLTKFSQAARFFGNFHSQHGLALLTQFGPLRHKTQPIKIHVGAAGDGHQFLIFQSATCDIRF